jgi:predicted phosphate transport protein (TIGR00153 family)
LKLLLSDVLSEEAMRNLEKYVESITNASGKFTEAVRLLNDVKISESQSSFSQVVKLLDQSGRYKAMLEDEIANSSLDPGFKEELLSLINQIDEVGDLVKESAREFTILPFLEIPIQLREGLLKLTRTVSEMISDLSELTKKALIMGEYSRVDAFVERLIELEEKADELELNNRAMLLSFSEKIKPHALHLLIHDLNSILENTADSCARTARRIKLLVVAWLGGVS